MSTPLFVREIGAGGPTLLLLHGLGANGAVWDALLPHLNWPGRILIPDLRGHGHSPHPGRYSLGHHAADVADLLTPDEPVHVVGHSMGGASGLVLASGMFGVEVARLVAFGTKTGFSPEELAKARAFSGAPVRWFDTREAAAARFLRVAGLDGLVDARAEVVEAGIVAEGGRYRLAADPATVLVAFAPGLADLVAGVRAPLRLLTGARDPMVSVAALRRFDPAAEVVAGAGHNPQVEAAAALAAVIRRFFDLA